jgi:hypothetical protein
MYEKTGDANMTDNVKQLRQVSARKEPTDPLQVELIAKCKELLESARSGELVGLFGIAVFDGGEEGDNKAEALQEGYTLSEADVVLGLEFVAKDLRESWESERFGIDLDGEE